eukprot:scaffold16995_cov127-Isochrysis_galbana.AAC.15
MWRVSSASAYPQSSVQKSRGLGCAVGSCTVIFLLYGCNFRYMMKTKLRERVEANDGAPTAPSGAGGGRYSRGKGLKVSPR